MLKGKVHYIGPKVKQKVKPIFDLSLENKFSPDPFYGHLEEGGGTKHQKIYIRWALSD